MLSFNQYNASDLNEEVVRNKHLDHLEDMMLLYGEQGLKDSIAFLKDIAVSLKLGKSPELKFSTKWDGKPAVVCGINPDNKKFFVATKSAFSKVVKAYHTPKEVKDAIPIADLADKLIQCLKHLPKIGIKGVLQGDLMFGEGAKKVVTLNGVEHIAFQPNTIMYAIPAKSEMGQRIANAKLGIAFHTEYGGNSMESLSAKTFNFDSSKLKKTADVWFTDPNIYDITPALLQPGEYDNLSKMIGECEALSKKVLPFLKTLKANADLMEILMPYINSTIGGGMTNYTSNGLNLYVTTRMDKEIEKLKSEKGKQSRQAQKQKLLDFVKTYSSQFGDMFTLHNRLANCKEILLGKFNAIGAFGHFFVDDEGIRPTDPEGIVVSRSGRVVKLVNRLRFSRQNRKVNQ